MTKIVKNNTGSTVEVGDVGIGIPASGQYTIQPQDYNLWTASDDIVTLVGDGTLTINDGSEDLGISDGIDLIKGIYQKNRIIGDTDGTLIGNDGDALKVSGEFSGPADGLEIKPTLSHQVDFNILITLTREMIRQMHILNLHMASITDLDGLEEE